MKFSRESSGRAVGLLCALLLQQIDGFFGAAVHGIVQREFVQAEVAVGFRRDGDFFDGAGAIVAAGARRWRPAADWPCCASMKKSLGKAHGLALIEGGDVVRAVLVHVDGAFVDVALAAA